MAQKTPQQILQELSAPFTKTVAGKVYPDLKWKPQHKAGNDKFICVPYIDRYHVSNRLNEVLGIDGWQFETTREADGSKTGSLSIFVSDKWITREDTGTENNYEGSKTSQKIEKEKAATSDALKRCGTHFGIGTYIKDIPNMFVDAKMNRSNKLTPVDKQGRFLYGDSLSAFCNGMSTAQGIIAQLLWMQPELWNREDIKKLWHDLKKL